MSQPSRVVRNARAAGASIQLPRAHLVRTVVAQMLAVSPTERALRYPVQLGSRVPVALAATWTRSGLMVMAANFCRATTATLVPRTHGARYLRTVTVTVARRCLAVLTLIATAATASRASVPAALGLARSLRRNAKWNQMPGLTGGHPGSLRRARGASVLLVLRQWGGLHAVRVP